MRRLQPTMVVIVLMGFLCGCSAPTNPNSDPTFLADPDQVTGLILEHLNEKYDEEFVADGDIEAPGWDIFGTPQMWTLCTFPIGGTKDNSLFCAQWVKPTLENQDEITDDYLLIKMRPLFRDALDNGLASVLPEFLAEYRLSDYPSDVSELPGNITDEEFLQWASENISVFVEMAIPAQDGFTKDDLSAQMEPLSGSGDTFGAAWVRLSVGASTQDSFQDLVSSWEATGARRTEPGMNWNLDSEGYQDPNLLFSTIITWGER